MDYRGWKLTFSAKRNPDECYTAERNGVILKASSRVAIDRAVDANIFTAGKLDENLDPKRDCSHICGVSTNVDMTQVDKLLEHFPLYRSYENGYHTWVYSKGKCDGNTAKNLGDILEATFNLTFSEPLLSSR